MDLTFKTKEGRFNYRVGAIIIDDNKLLMVTNSNKDYYYSVGGRVKFGETAEKAILREAKEETGIDFAIDYLAFVHENFFTERQTKEIFHELAFYYVLKPKNDLSKIICKSVTEEGISESLEWLKLNQLEQYEIYPTFLRQEVNNLNSKNMKWINKN